MEGVLFVIKAWGLVGAGLWMYRRFFERVARADSEFEAWCRKGQTVAAMHGDAQTLKDVEATLRGLLGKPLRVVATLGGWPWTSYGLEIRPSRGERALKLLTMRGDLLRTHGEPPPSLVGILRTLSARHPEVGALWLCSGAVYQQHTNEAPYGWLLEPGAESKPRLVACSTEPAWLTAAADERAATEVRPAPSPKFRKFRAEC